MSCVCCQKIVQFVFFYTKSNDHDLYAIDTMKDYELFMVRNLSQ